MDWFSFIIALVGIIIPFVNNILNNKHQAKLNLQNNNCTLSLNTQNNEQLLKTKELEFLYSGKSEKLGNYLDDLVSYLDEHSDENLRKYKISMAKACMFASKKVYREISSVNYYIKNGRITDAENRLYNELLPVISKDSFNESMK